VSPSYSQTWSLFASITRLHIVAIAAMGTFTFGWLFTGSYPWLVAGLCALDWFLVNLLNRVVDLKEDRLNAIVGTDFAAKNRKFILAFAFLLLFASLIFSHVYWPDITPFRLGYHVLGLAYNWPLLPGRRRLKTLYFWKNTASAMGFMLTVFCYPLAAAGWRLEASELPFGISMVTIGLTASWFFLFELSYEVIYDLRDAAGDKEAGVLSYPVVHGEKGAMLVIDLLLACSLIPLIGGWLLGVIPWRITVMAVATVLQFFLYKHWHSRGITQADCIRLTWLGAGLLFSYHLWVVAGLPGVGLPPS
jgi:4-hydroxybenzoate polyprenyltransferase